MWKIIKRLRPTVVDLLCVVLIMYATIITALYYVEINQLVH